MKDLRLLVWITQLGLSVLFPLAGFIVLAVWLRNCCGWGDWVIFVGIALGIITAITGFRDILKVISRTPGGKQSNDPPPISFNDHD